MPSAPPEFRTILGIPFFLGSVDAAVERMQSGGLLAVPAAPALVELASNPSYRDALLHADLVLPDSAFMVLAWNMLQRDHTRRLSGLTYLRRLLQHPSVRRAGNCLWVMPSEESSMRNLAWLAGQGIEVPPIGYTWLRSTTLFPPMRCWWSC